MPSRNIELSDDLDRFLEDSVLSGRYRNASEVVRDSLQLLEEIGRDDALKLRRLKAAVQAGIDDAREGRTIRIPDGGLRDYLSKL